MGAPESRTARDLRGSILCLVGPTACGKTGLIMRLAARLPLEVISLDSRQIFQGLRIGTAQPTVAEMAVCPHHLVDFVPVDQPYDAACFRQDFLRVYAAIRSRGNIPVLVGGAGFYLKALTDGFMPLPAGRGRDLQEIRAEVNAMPAETLRARLAAVDPRASARIHPHDLYRQRRALEIFLLTGRCMTEHMSRWRPEPCLDLDFGIVILERDVDELDLRIRRRLELMLDNGWLEETEQAWARYGPGAPGLQSIGYPEIIRHLQGKFSRSQLEETIYLRTRQYAKRQRTWFRRLPSVLTGHPGDDVFRDEIATMLAGSKCSGDN